MATQKFSNFSIDYILGETSKQTAESPGLDHPASSQDFPGHLAKLDLLYQDGPRGHSDHEALMMNFPSPSWNAGMYSCCVPVSYYQPPFNSHYYAAQPWPSAVSGMHFSFFFSSFCYVCLLKNVIHFCAYNLFIF